MSQPSQTVAPTSPETLPPEMWEHLRDLNPNSHEFAADLAAANSLAAEAGYAALTLADIFPPQELTPPSGFSREVALTKPVLISTEQFAGRIHSLREQGSAIAADVHVYTTDLGNSIAVCDLRGLMTNSVREGGPTSERGEDAALDRAFLNDLKFYADQGHARRSVHGVRGVNYSRVNGTKIRGYWMPVMPDNPLGMPLIGRIADCGNSVRGEEALYNRVFKQSVSL